MQGYSYQVTFSWRHRRTQSDVSDRQQTARQQPRTRTLAAPFRLSGRPVVLGATDVFQFQPNGTVTTLPASSAPYTFTITYSGTTETITVSNYGNIDVTP